ncbi:hypothetical protein [Palleronia caenipelagi]|uniref:Uncharacterized protein n=1 Tax=Palleronia caenipelagi TaxID=2489174 RepID=A0A547PS47_9RHOB|nr:hypothetical protein [Palleronia caenipelagi]TRD16960.1 hypothetical protein FEV53_13570 [Palleronia caenipelagi]
MAQSKMKWVACLSNLTVPAAVLGADEDQKMQTGVPVQLPRAYADHLIADRLAEACEAPEAKAGPKASAGRKAKPTKAPADQTSKVNTSESAEITAARKAVADRQTALDMVEGTDEADQARGDLLAAQQALAALEARS